MFGGERKCESLVARLPDSGLRGPWWWNEMNEWMKELNWTE